MPEYPEIEVVGHHNPVAGLRDMDREGIAAEVMYHFGMNGQPLPFVTNPAGALAAVLADGLKLGAVSYRAYNEWLADFIATDPDRLLGLAYNPSWDIHASVREVEWAASVGLVGINFPLTLAELEAMYARICASSDPIAAQWFGQRASAVASQRPGCGGSLEAMRSSRAATSTVMPTTMRRSARSASSSKSRRVPSLRAVV